MGARPLKSLPGCYVNAKGIIAQAQQQNQGFSPGNLSYSPDIALSAKKEAE
jgi:hypothetical protein